AAIPVIVLGRLALDAAWAGKGIGAALLRDAIYRTEHIAVQVGVRALLVHALNDEVVAFYTKFGFETSAVNALTLLFPVKV
ncbi:GNAT family N-acetyltransferase, partial [Xanthomonas citri pv. citri]|nr:GNAT family N-acetyltransferase [Xanthomonas citri pv. citri]